MYLSCLLINLGDDPDREDWRNRNWLRNLYRVHQRLAMAFPSDQRRNCDPEFLAPYKSEDFPEQRHLADQKDTEIDPAALAQVHTARSAGAGFLFRVDPLPGGRAMIVVLSHQEPDWSYAFGLYSDLTDPQTKRPIGNAGHLLAALPDKPRSFQISLNSDARFRFRLTANPTKKTDTLSKEERLAKTPKRHGRRVAVPPEQFRQWLVARSKQHGFRLVGPLEDTLITVAGYVYVNKTHDSSKGQRLRSVRYDGLLEIVDVERFRKALHSGIGPAKAFGFGLLSVAPA